MSQENLRSRVGWTRAGHSRKGTGLERFLSGPKQVLRLTSCEACHFTSLRTLCRAGANIIITPEMIYAKSQALRVNADLRTGMVKIFYLFVLG